MREAADVHFVDDELFPGDIRFFVTVPVKWGRDPSLASLKLWGGPPGVWRSGAVASRVGDPPPSDFIGIFEVFGEVYESYMPNIWIGTGKGELLERFLLPRAK